MENSLFHKLSEEDQKIYANKEKPINNGVLQSCHQNTRFNCKSGIYKKIRQQRLIPLTLEIVEAMMDFNASHSSSSIAADKPFYHTFSITSLVREEVQNILQELSVSEHFIRKEDIDDLIARCLRDRVSVIQEEEEPKTSPPASTASESDTNQELEVTVEMIKDNDKNNLIVENFQILEQRITSLEERISTVLQTIPKLRYLQSKKFKINTDVIREELRQYMDRIELKSLKDTMQSEEEDDANVNTNGINPTEKPVPKQNIIITPLTVRDEVNNMYNDMYYEQRQHAMNMLNYKKSTATIELNDRPQFNPNIKPIKIEYPVSDFQPKPKPTFITD